LRKNDATVRERLTEVAFQMEDTEIKKLLRVQSRLAGRRGWRCPDEVQLAAYVAQRLSSSARNSIEAHVADCDFCLSQVAFLTQSADWANSVDVPANLLSGARSLVARKPSRGINWGWRWAVSTAAVACFALLFFLVALQLRRQQSVSPPSGPLVAQQTSPERVPSPQITVASPPSRPEPTQPVQTPKAKSTQAPMVRSKTAEDLLPKLISPRDGAVVRREDLEFRWEPVSDAIFYEVRVMSAEGDLVFEGQTENTRLKLGSSAPLVPGTKYFVVARAHLRQGKAAKSGLVSFRLAAQ
jgi:hypothetical protein